MIPLPPLFFYFNGSYHINDIAMKILPVKINNSKMYKLKKEKESALWHLSKNLLKV